jgi:hypothetical protein
MTMQRSWLSSLRFGFAGHWPAFRRFGRTLSATHLCASLVLGALALASGCGELPDEHRVEGTRILALRTEVVGTWLPGTDADPRARADALPFETVAFRPYAAAPNGPYAIESVANLWLVCELLPGEGIGGCSRRLAETGVRDLNTVAACTPPSPTLLDDPSQIPGENPPCVISTAVGENPLFQVSPSLAHFAGADLEITVFSSSDPAQSPASCASTYLAASTKLNRACIIGQQRLEIGPDETLLALGQSLAGDGAMASFARQDSIPSFQEIPSDRHPRITEMRVLIERIGEINMPIVVNDGDIVDVREGDLLTVEVSSPAEDLQSYVIDGNGPVESRIREEAYEGQWFRTWGDLLSGESDDPESYNRWELLALKDDSELGLDRLAHLYYVVRDGRQGVAWRTLTVRVAPLTP